MQGKATTQKTADLPLIFWHIRTTRATDTKTRRSWMRRAKIALDAIDYLTPAERHEVLVVWSKNNVSRIDSPALRKLLGRPTGDKDLYARTDYEHIPAKANMRAGFTPSGEKKRRVRKPDAVTAWGIDHGPAANDALCAPVQLSLISDAG